MVCETHYCAAPKETTIHYWEVIVPVEVEKNECMPFGWPTTMQYSFEDSAQHAIMQCSFWVWEATTGSWSVTITCTFSAFIVFSRVG